MTKDELKSLASSVTMLKNMVESIVTTVQDRFKDNDKIIVSLKEKIENFENKIDETSISGDTGQITVNQELLKKVEQLGVRLDKLNERILLVEAAKSVKTEIPAAKPVIDISDIEDITKAEDKTEIVTPKEPAPAPAPAPAIPIPEVKTSTPSVIDAERPVSDVAKKAPTTPAPAPAEPPAPTPAPISKPAPAPISKPAPAIPIPEVKTSTPSVIDAERPVSDVAKKAPASPIPKPPTVVDQVQVTDDVETTVPKTEETEKTDPEPAELFEEAVNGDKSELLKALKKLEDI